MVQRVRLVLGATAGLWCQWCQSSGLRLEIWSTASPFSWNLSWNICCSFGMFFFPCPTKFVCRQHLQNRPWTWWVCSLQMPSGPSIPRFLWSGQVLWVRWLRWEGNGSGNLHSLSQSQEKFPQMSINEQRLKPRPYIYIYKYIILYINIIHTYINWLIMVD